MIELAMAFFSSFSKIMQIAKPSEIIPMMEIFFEKSKLLGSEEDTIVAMIMSKSLARAIEPSAKELNEFVERAQKDPQIKPSVVLAKILEAAKKNLAKDPSLDQPMMTPEDISNIEELTRAVSKTVFEIFGNPCSQEKSQPTPAPKNRNGESIN